MKRVLQTIWEFVTSTFSEDEFDEDMALFIDFERAKRKIAEKNKRELIENQLMPFVISEILHNENYLPTEKEARKISEDFFETSKKLGNIDELNRVVERRI